MPDFQPGHNEANRFCDREGKASEMRKILKFSVCTGAIFATSATAALASVPTGTAAPIAEGGLLGIAAAGVIGGIWLARRKR